MIPVDTEPGVELIHPRPSPDKRLGQFLDLDLEIVIRSTELGLLETRTLLSRSAQEIQRANQSMHNLENPARPDRCPEPATRRIK